MALVPDNNGRFDHRFEIVSSVFSAGLSYHKLEKLAHYAERERS